MRLKIIKNNLNRLNDMLDRRMDAGVSSNSDKDLLNARIEQINSDMIIITKDEKFKEYIQHGLRLFWK